MTVRTILLLFLLLLLGACAPSRGVYHTVQEGQTLYRIGRVYGVDERYLARINRIDNPAQLRVGTRLYVPGAERVKPVPVAVATKAPTKRPPLPPQSPVSGKRPSAKPAKPKPSAENRPGSSPPATSGKTAPVVAGKFSWPLRGRVLKGFGGTSEAPIKGLEIAAVRGTPILSAAAGRVIYSGNGIPSYGNLVILKHDNDFFTVYGFNDKNIVDVGIFVSKGERIALSGAPPAGGTPRLYFEIRHGKEPVDPIFYLP